MNFGKAVKVVCAMRGMQQREIAERTGIDESVISRFSTSQPSVRTLMRVCDALQVPLYLLCLIASEEADLYSLPIARATDIAEQLLALLKPVSPTR